MTFMRRQLKVKKNTPNITLTRFLFMSDCTIGKLVDEKDNLIGYTMEPPYRLSSERFVVGNTAIPEGIYLLKLEFDPTLRYKCLKLGHVNGFSNIRICFLTKASAYPQQTKCNILIGCNVDKENGVLTDCINAFKRLKTYYESKRCNHSELCLEIKNLGFEGRSKEHFCKMTFEEEQPLEDYELQTI